MCLRRECCKRAQRFLNKQHGAPVDLRACFEADSKAASIMASHRSQKQTTTLAQHRTPDLSALLKQASFGRKRDVLMYLHRGGSPEAVAEVDMAGLTVTVPLLQSIILQATDPQAANLGESMKLLLEAGAQVDRAATGSADQQRTALMYAAAAPGASLLRVLLRYGADAVIASKTDGLTALHAAAAAGLDDNCEMLLAAGADLQAED
jgi:Ankyrin repeats (3 copies)